MKWVLIVLYLDVAGMPHAALTAEFDSFPACESAAQAQVKAALTKQINRRSRNAQHDR